ncbi:hypothetical protein [Roseiterribacter gracilis]
MKRTFLLRAASALALLVPLAGCYVAPPHARGVVEIRAPYAPPTPRYEVVPTAPYETAIWDPGHWHWNGVAYVWEAGHWVERPHVRAVWEPGHWVAREGGWVWVGGHWR